MSEHQQDYYYATLNVSHDAEIEVIRAAYKALMIKHHPDHNPSNSAEEERRTEEINEAYHILSDPDRRAAYDYSFQGSHVEREAKSYNQGSGGSSFDSATGDSNGGRHQAAAPPPRETGNSSSVLVGSMRPTVIWVSIWVALTAGLLIYRNDAHNLPPVGVNSTPPDVQTGTTTKDSPVPPGALSQRPPAPSPEVARPQEAQPFSDTNDGKLLRPFIDDVGKRYSPALHDCLSAAANSVDGANCIKSELKLQESLRDRDGGSIRNIYRVADREMAECAHDGEAMSALVCQLRTLTEINYAQGARVNQTPDNTTAQPPGPAAAEDKPATSAGSLLTESQAIRQALDSGRSTDYGAGQDGGTIQVRDEATQGGRPCRSYMAEEDGLPTSWSTVCRGTDGRWGSGR